MSAARLLVDMLLAAGAAIIGAHKSSGAQVEVHVHT